MKASQSLLRKLCNETSTLIIISWTGLRRWIYTWKIQGRGVAGEHRSLYIVASVLVLISNWQSWCAYVIIALNVVIFFLLPLTAIKVILSMCLSKFVACLIGF